MADGARPGESFLARRARLKYDRQHGRADPEAPPGDGPATSLPESPPAAESAVPAPSRDAMLPPVESLTDEADFSGYLAEGVSEGLRRAALHKLFHLPQFNVIDGLDDYAEDYTVFEKLGDVVTAHQHAMRAGSGAPPADDTGGAPGSSPALAEGVPDATDTPEAAHAAAARGPGADTEAEQPDTIARTRQGGGDGTADPREDDSGAA